MKIIYVWFKTNQFNDVTKRTQELLIADRV